jgi:hypothetical protein
MTNGMFFQVDLHATLSFNQVVLDAAGSSSDFPRGYQLFVSNDGTNFGSAVVSGAGAAALVTITFPTQSARFIKVVQTGASSFWWSIAELNVFAAGGGSGSGGSGGTDAGSDSGGGGSTTSTPINCGGPSAAPYVADVDFSGGTVINHANAIDTSAVSEPAPVAVYQSARIGNFTYAVSGLIAGSNHTVRLHFAETFFNTAGSRVFNVSINGAAVLTNFDIFAAAGAENKAIVRSFTATASSGGSATIQFTSVVNNSLISGIEIQ